MEDDLPSGAGRLRKRLPAALFVATALQEPLSGAPVVARAADDAPEPTAYVRRTYEVKVPFFTQYWWVGFLVLFIVFLMFMLVLYAAVQCHFKESEQRRRRKEIEATQFPMEKSSSEDEVASDGGSHASRSGRSASSNPLCVGS
ncbi:hypothetical protein GH5_07564 [Leishmania sp. Ghana 2012 LV757]|uniref:hypothetical protein n=1 Tax=Leishmania sp. Ghana 2012 LV757 TaxID=2803181 RepID=UPI001B412EA7|nr:hypothetical protein GH5_07564 [Leishmania sp. Ghana 2012 LV757]